MTIQEMKERKKELGYSNSTVAELSGVPLGTVQKIFSGATASPRYETLRALEAVLKKKSVYPFSEGNPFKFGESVMPYLTKKQGEYTLKDYYNLPEDKRFELIDGVIYDMTAPTTIHQSILGRVHANLLYHIDAKGGQCIPMISPVDVQLDCDDKTMVEPDVIIVWPVDSVGSVPAVVMIYDFEHDDYRLASFDDKIPVSVLDNECIIDFAALYDRISFLYEQE